MAGEPLLPTHSLEHSSLATREAAFGPRQKVGSRCMRRDVGPGTPGRRRKCVSAWQRECGVWVGRRFCSLPRVCVSTAKHCFMPFSCAGLTAGCTPALAHGAANLAGPWNVTQAHFCGLAPLPGEGAKRPLARPAGSCDLRLVRSGCFFLATEVHLGWDRGRARPSQWVWRWRGGSHQGSWICGDTEAASQVQAALWAGTLT